MNSKETGDLILTQEQKDHFASQGYLVIREFVSAQQCAAINTIVEDSLHPPLAPLEFEADVRYPGAPVAKTALGGFTPRRLLHAYTRETRFRQAAANEKLLAVLKQLMSAEHVALSQNHHNCVMTKYPGFGSETNWHQDVRYWSFDRPELVSMWLALGEEYSINGGLSLIPGSHLTDLDRGRLDANLFLRTDLPENLELIDSAVSANLSCGDVLLFHCRTYHAAGQNRSTTVKKSLVYTYRDVSNQPIPDTRSATYEDIELA